MHIFHFTKIINIYQIHYIYIYIYIHTNSDSQLKKQNFLKKLSIPRCEQSDTICIHLIHSNWGMFYIIINVEYLNYYL